MDATPAGLRRVRRDARCSGSTQGAARAVLRAPDGHRAHGATIPADGVLDPDGRVYGVEGLLVVDGSAFPNASGRQPDAHHHGAGAPRHERAYCATRSVVVVERFASAIALMR
jgi:hypothetical protein